MERDWFEWHQPYADPASPLSRRLRLVQRQLHRWLDEESRQSLRVVSVCAGQGRDLLEVLSARSDSSRVSAVLLEYDARNVAAAISMVEAKGLAGVTVRQADAGELASYSEALPADLLLMAGVFGNISDDDANRTIDRLPMMCSAGATVIWTRSRRSPDVTPLLRARFAAAGFRELAFEAPEDVLFTVGVHRFEGQPVPEPGAGRMFSFIS
jgi:Putative methyltransferase